MPTASPYTCYSFSLSNIAKISLSLLRGKQRSFQMDASQFIQSIHPPAVIHGHENISKHGPMLILLNHYARSGFLIIWAAFAISAALPVESCWVMTRAWTATGKFFGGIQSTITEALFTKIAKMYGFISMPPMPPDPRDALDRAIGVRNLIQKARKMENVAICMAPEGRDYPGGNLGWSAEGSGKLILQLSQYIPTTIPAGVYEKQGSLHIHFGKELNIKQFQGPLVDNKQVDRFMMKAIAQLIPENLRGDFT